MTVPVAVPYNVKVANWTVSDIVKGPASSCGKANRPSLPAVVVWLYGMSPAPETTTRPAVSSLTESKATPLIDPVPRSLSVTSAVAPAGTSATSDVTSILSSTSTLSVAVSAGSRSNANLPFASVVVEKDVPATRTVTSDGGAAV